MSIKLQLPELTDLKPRIVVIGVGGAGCNAVNNMIAAGLTGVEFVVANTDAQSLAVSSAEYRIQLGAKLTEGLGAGSKPEIGEAAAEEALDEIRAQVQGAHMVFIAAGMGGGTGTGAAATIAKTAKDLGILTVGVVTKPFHFEGSRRMRTAEAGIAELKGNVDTLIVIPNQNLFRLANEKTTFSEAFILADQVLYSGVACIVDLIIKEGLINLDFADVRTVISGMGAAMMGTGEASGERRAIEAAEEAIANPLLDDVSLEGARGLLLSITGGTDLTLYEVDEAATRIRQEVDPDANIIVGATFDETLGDRVRVSIVASGLRGVAAERPVPRVADDWKSMALGNAQAAPVDYAEPQPARFIPPAPETSLPSQANAVQPGTSSDSLKHRLTSALQTSASASSFRSAPPPLPEIQSEHHSDAELDNQGETVVGYDDETYNYGEEPWSDDESEGLAIEDGFPTPVHPPQDGYATYENQVGYNEASEQSYANGPYEPEMTEPMPRNSRRMPTVEDFPPHAQREYHHKHHYGTPNYQGAGAGETATSSAPRKRTLFERLRGRANESGDSPVDSVENYDTRYNSAVSAHNQPTSSDPRDGQYGRDGDQQRVAQGSDLPMFFSRTAR